MIREQCMELVRKVGLVGLSDLRKLAPIGDMGYLNSFQFHRHDFVMGVLPSAVMKAFAEQREKYGFSLVELPQRWACDHHYHCPELGLYYSIDSSD